MKRFPFIKQKDSMQCGVACLASICEYYGKKYSTQFISKLCSCTPTGISLQSLKLTAEQFDHVIIFPS
ncbi:cysteine peptidase family C39 domain-containing protein [Prevotella sp.]|uniref:cysteine peptidase family C39 domain-containing protein n=1 Tax=Prevotella sp. TaxID=59823 RepID=UPI0027E37780|nr:cysteine peptidase family C39 domain-containing protein [Prevotella sp.]